MIKRGARGFIGVMSETNTPAGVDWEQRFRDEDAPWERDHVHPAVAHWAAAGVLTPGARIHVPGCGRGREPEALARLGLAVTAVDLSETAMAWQRARLGDAGLDAALVTGDALAFRPDPPADLVWEQTFLCAINPHDRKRYEAMAFDSLAPGGRLLALFMQKEERGGPPYGCGLDAMRALFAPARWSWPAPETFTAFAHPSMGPQAEIAVVLSRR